MKSSILTAIDVGTTKVVTTIAEVENGKILRIAGVGITPSSGMHKGLVVGIQDAKQSIRESVKRAEFASGRKVTSAYIGVTGRHVSSLNRRAAVTMGRNDRAVGFNDLKRVIQNARRFQIPNGQKLLHIIPRSYAVNGGSGVKDPVGMPAHQLDVE